jgi:Phage P22-like portal protein
MADLNDEAVEFLRLATEAESSNRAEAIADLKFVNGEQWPAELMNSRQIEKRPCLTINKIEGFCRQVANQQRQQRPRMKAHGTNSEATKKVADVITGMCRHIEVNSNADSAYDTAFDLATKIGWGYWRITTDYIREDSFDQDIYINAIENPFTVYFDPNSTLLDGSDAEKCLISDVMSKEKFKRLYPGFDDGANFVSRGTGDQYAEWVTKEDIRIAEYFRVDRVKETLLMLSDKNVLWKDEYDKYKAIIDQAGVHVVGERQSWKRKVKWCKLTAMEVIEEKDWPGRWIPIIPTYGNIANIEGKRRKFGMVRFGKDPQRMYNYWSTAATESIALAPKAKWLIAEGQDEGHENEWSNANVSATSTLRYKTTDVDGQQVPPPQRLQPEPPPEGIIAMLQQASNEVREVVGVHDPAMRIQGNVSGKALNAEKQQSDNATFHYYDNLTLSIGFTGRQIVDLIPKIYDTERVMRIIGDDGKPDLITINEHKTTSEGEVIENNLQVGEYDIVMDTGPGYNSKRLEAVDAIAPLMQNEELMHVVGDLFFRNSDFPGAEVIADRLAAMNPLAQIDEKLDIPPQVQMKLKQNAQTIKQLEQQLQAAGIEIKFKTGIEKMKQDGQTQRTHMVEVGKAHDTMVWAEQDSKEAQRDVQGKAHDAAIGYRKAMDVEEIRAQVALLLARIDERSAAKSNAEEKAE